MPSYSEVRDTLRAALTLRASTRDGRDRGLLIGGAALFVALLGCFLLPSPTFEGSLGIGAVTVLAIAVVLAAVLAILLLRLATLSFWAGLLLVLVAGAMALIPAGFAPLGIVPALLLFALAAALIGGGWASARYRGWQWPSILALGAGIAALLAWSIVLLVPGWQAHAKAAANLPALPTPFADPGASGPLGVHSFTYGSGKDRHREEFAAGAEVRSRSVDGSKLLDGWDGAAGWARTRYWGFDASALPLNGRVWMPRGAGPFPVVLIVHGNHLMTDFSDVGYAYLGEHFASHGFVAISVDENFLNSGDSDLLSGLDGGLDSENDARGWLLLEHLRQLREWNTRATNPFHGRLDLQRIVLIGHSRGGEAAADAALFNGLSHYPDDARVRFDYGFGIRGVIAIAPADGQYDPRARATRLRDLSYLSVHGSHDGDVQSFIGSAQYARVRFSNCSRCFKSTMYVVGANHGQFNTSWGRSDYGLPGRLLLDLEPIMDAEDQRRIAKGLFTAFLLATLQDRAEYRELFAQAPQRAPWLRNVVELRSDYAGGDELVVADFEEDDDVATTTMRDARIVANALARWREEELELKWGRRDSASVLLGWHAVKGTPTPSYYVRFAQSPAASTAIGLSLAMSGESPLEDPEAEWTTPETLDASVVVIDGAGHRARIALSSIGEVRAPVEAQTRKFAAFDRTATSEPIFQRFTIPLARFSGVDPGRIIALGLEFDRSPRGALHLDELRLVTSPAPAISAPGSDESAPKAQPK